MLSSSGLFPPLGVSLLVIRRYRERRTQGVQSVAGDRLHLLRRLPGSKFTHSEWLHLAASVFHLWFGGGNILAHVLTCGSVFDPPRTTYFPLKGVTARTLDWEAVFSASWGSGSHPQNAEPAILMMTNPNSKAHAMEMPSMSESAPPKDDRKPSSCVNKKNYNYN